MSRRTPENINLDPVQHLPSDVWINIFSNLIPPSHGGNPDLKNLGIVRRELASLSGLYVDAFQSSKEDEDYPVAYKKPMREEIESITLDDTKKKTEKSFPKFKGNNFLYPVLNEALTIENSKLYSWSAILSPKSIPSPKKVTYGKWNIKTMFRTNKFFSSVIDIEKNIRVKNIMKFVIRFSLVSKSWRKSILDGGNACTIVWDYLASIVFGTAFFAPKYVEQWVNVGKYREMLDSLVNMKRLNLNLATPQELLTKGTLSSKKSSSRNTFIPRSNPKSFLPVSLDKKQKKAFNLDSLSEKVNLVYRFMFIPHYYNCLMLRTDIEFPVKFHLLKFDDMYNIESGPVNFDTYKVPNFGIYLELSRDLLGGLLPTDYYDMNAFFDDYIRKPSLEEVSDVKKYLNSSKKDILGILLDVIDKYEEQVKCVLKKRKGIQTQRKKLPMSPVEKENLLFSKTRSIFYQPLSRSIFGLTKMKLEIKKDTIEHLLVIVDIAKSHLKKRNEKSVKKVDVPCYPQIIGDNLNKYLMDSTGIINDFDDFDSEDMAVYYETVGEEEEEEEEKEMSGLTLYPNHLIEQVQDKEKPYYSEDEVDDANSEDYSFEVSMNSKKRKRNTTISNQSSTRRKKAKVTIIDDGDDDDEE